MILQQLLREFPGTPGSNAAKQFLEEYFFRSPYSVPGGCHAVIDWTAATTCSRLLPQPGLDLLVTRQGQPWPGAPVDSQAAGEAALADGYTLCIRHADRHDPLLEELAAKFQADFLAPIDVHVYCTPAEAPGFSWHYDAEEVFILQTEGSKDWWLRKNTVNLWPLVETIPADMRYEREIMPALHCQLRAGDWLYIPAGYWHRTSATEMSTSLSVGIQSPSGIDVIDFLRKRLLDDLRWRQRLPVLGSAAEGSQAEAKAALATMIQELAADLQRQITRPDFLQKFIESRQREFGPPSE